MVRNGPGKAREKAETGSKGTIWIVLLSQVITKMKILHHQNSEEQFFFFKWNIYSIAKIMECYHSNTDIFFACYGMHTKHKTKCNQLAWPGKLLLLLVKKSLLSWACCDAYLAQRCAEGTGRETDEGAFKGHCTQTATEAMALQCKSMSYPGKSTVSCCKILR